MNEQRIAIITDSGTDTGATFCRKHDVRVLPLRINYSNGDTYRSGVDIDSHEVIRRFGEEVPTTSLPSPDEILETLRQAKRDGYERAVIITIASALSATNQTAQLMAEQMDDFPCLVFDTRNIGMVAGMVVMRAVEYVEGGVPFEGLEDRLREDARRTSIFFAVKSLDYLYKGGRISTAIYRVGSVLNIKPVLTCDENGAYVIAKKAHGWDRALGTLVRSVALKANRFTHVRLAICCTEVTRHMREELERRIRKAVNAHIDCLLYHDLKPDLIVHTGPDLVGMGVQGL